MLLHQESDHTRRRPTDSRVAVDQNPAAVHTLFDERYRRWKVPHNVGLGSVGYWYNFVDKLLWKSRLNDICDLEYVRDACLFETLSILCGLQVSQPEPVLYFIHIVPN